MSNWLSRLFTVPRHDREKINKTLEENPQLLAFVNLIKSVAVGAAVEAATSHISDPTAHTAAAIAISTAVERAVPTPHETPETAAALVPGPGVQNISTSMSPTANQLVPPTP